MGFNHVAIATRNLEAAHQFYTEAMGFRLVHVEAGDAPEGDVWFRHVFYDTGDGSMLALSSSTVIATTARSRHFTRARAAELGEPHRLRSR